MQLAKSLSSLAILATATLCPLHGSTDPIEVDAGNAIELSTSELFGFAPIIEFQTSQGNIPVELSPERAPLTVANFMRYVEGGLYVDSLFHRSAVLQDGTPFVIQGGGFFFDQSGELPQLQFMPTFDPVENEPNVSNVRGTIAMAKLGGNPDSATSQWFFNLSDNGPILDDQNGGFTVFGEVVGDGMIIVDAIADLERFNLSQNFGSAFNEVPLTITADQTLEVSSFVTLSGVVTVPPSLADYSFPDGGDNNFTVSVTGDVIRIAVDSEAASGDFRISLQGASASGDTESAERTLRVAGSAQASWYDSSVELEDQWRWFEWLEFFNVSNAPWIFHQEHGWLLPFAESPESVFFWDPVMESFLWTSESVYPSLYRFSDDKWIFYDKGSSNPRWFVDLATGIWEQW